MVQVGRPAPLFNLEAYFNGKFERIALDKLRGKWVVLFFYPADFTFICPTEITEFSKHIKDFEKLNAVVLGCSTDSVHAHKAWMKELGEVKYPLLSDMTHATSRDYGVLIEDKGIALRGTYIIDPEGVVRIQLVHDNSVGRSVSECLRVLEGLQTGERCPVEWKPGQKTLGKD